MTTSARAYSLARRSNSAASGFSAGLTSAGAIHQLAGSERLTVFQIGRRERLDHVLAGRKFHPRRFQKQERRVELARALERIADRHIVLFLALAMAR